jgi:hypothetical protein
MFCGGHRGRPGEISLAHLGVLFWTSRRNSAALWATHLAVFGRFGPFLSVTGNSVVERGDL